MKETDGICLVGPWQACDIPREKMGSLMGELEAVLIPCLLGWCQTYVDTIIGGWFPGPARAGPAVWPHPVHAGSWGEARMMQAVGPHYVSPSLPCDS